MNSTKAVYTWSTIDRIGTATVTTIGNIILARMLTPDDFGLVAMVGIFIAIAYNMSNCGMIDGIIRKSCPTAEDYSTMLVFNAAMGLLFCALFLAMAHPIAQFFGRRELVGIMWTIGFCFVFNALSLSQEARMRKELRTDQLAKVRVGSTICAVGFGIILAMIGAGYWAIVSCRGVVSVFHFIFCLFITRWMPRLAFYRDSFKELFGFGVHLMMAFVARQIGANISTFALGRYSPTASGLYSQAQKVEEVPYGIAETSFVNVFFAILSNEDDHNKRRTLTFSMFQTMLFLALILGGGLLVISRPMIVGVFGEQWAGSVPIFRILLAFGIFGFMKSYFQAIMKTHGTAKKIRNLTFIEVGLQLLLLACAYPLGITYIAWSQVIPVFLVLLAYTVEFMRTEQISFKLMAKATLKTSLIPFIVTASTASGYFFGSDNISLWANFFTIIAVYLTIAALLCEGFRPKCYMQVRNAIMARRQKNQNISNK